MRYFKCDKCQKTIDKPYLTLSITASGLLWNKQTRELDFCQECGKSEARGYNLKESDSD